MSVPASAALPSVNEPLNVDTVPKYVHSHPDQLELLQEILLLIIPLE